MESTELLSRRAALGRIGWLIGGAAAVPAFSSLLAGCQVGTPAYQLQTFTPAQGEAVASLAEVIIPTTDTPGARAAKVHEYIDLFLTEWYPPEVRDTFLTGMEAVEAQCLAAHGQAFAALPPATQQAEMAQWAEAARAHQGEGRPFFSWLKEMTMLGYYSSEIGASQELRFVAAPGYYDGCVPFEEIGRTWA